MSSPGNLLIPTEKLYNIIQDRGCARKQRQPANPLISDCDMVNRSWSTNIKLVGSFIALAALIVFSSILAGTVKINSAKRASATISQNELNMLVLAIRGDVAESMLPAHDYLIEPNPSEEQEFNKFRVKITKTFHKLQRSRHFEPVDIKILKEAFSQFKKLESIQNEIFALRGGDIARLGPKKMEHMHVYQHAILIKLGRLNELEQAELASFVSYEKTSSRRSVLLIGAAAALAIVGALLVGYLSREM